MSVECKAPCPSVLSDTRIPSRANSHAPLIHMENRKPSRVDQTRYSISPLKTRNIGSLIP